MEKIHLTLVFLGNVGAERVPGLLAMQIGGRAFEMRLDCAGAFRKARVAWAGTETPLAQLAGLQSSLVKQLAKAGFALEDRPFAPHVTLARKIGASIIRSPVEAIAWKVRKVALVRSDTATRRYSTLKDWKLGD